MGKCADRGLLLGTMRGMENVSFFECCYSRSRPGEGSFDWLVVCPNFVSSGVFIPFTVYEIYLLSVGNGSPVAAWAKETKSIDRDAAQ